MATRRVPHLVVLSLLLAFLASGTARAETLVSLGDSYSSGEGAGAYDTAAGNCHRSANAWPRLLGVTAPNLLACSGATTTNVLYSAKRPDPQTQINRLAAIAAASPDVTVLLTIGGNDAHFGAKVRSCRLNPRGCLKDPRALDDELAAITPELIDTYRQISQVPGVTRVIVVGYPDLVPSPGTATFRCGWLTAAKQRNIERFAGQLDDALAGAAAQVGVPYLSIRNALAGHELCTRNSWMNALTRGGHNPLDSQQGHPNPDGQKAIAAAVRNRISNAAPAPHVLFDADLDGHLGATTLDAVHHRRRVLALGGRQDIDAIAPLGGYLYLDIDGPRQRDRIVRVTTSGLRPSTIIDEPQIADACSLVVTAGHLYWLHGPPVEARSIARSNLDGSGLQPHFVRLPGQEFVEESGGEGLTADGPWLYFGREFDNQIGRVGVDGRGLRASFVQLAPRYSLADSTDIQYLAAVGGWIYFSNWDTGRPNSGYVGKVAEDGSGLETRWVFTGRYGPYALATYGRALYIAHNPAQTGNFVAIELSLLTGEQRQIPIAGGVIGLR